MSRTYFHGTKAVRAIEVQLYTVIEFANNLDPVEAAHNELPHLDLQCLPPCLGISIYDIIGVRRGGQVLQGGQSHHQ